MILIEKTEVMGIEQAIRGMRNPMNSWDKSDTDFDHFGIGVNDYKLMLKLAKGGPVHAKYRRMIVVYVDITAPLYWWKEFDTYKVGTVANSCSTMHKIQDKPFTLNDFSCEHLIRSWGNPEDNKSFIFSEFDVPLDKTDDLSDTFYFESANSPLNVLEHTIEALNTNRLAYIVTKDKRFWWQMIQLLPSSYNQKRTIMLNYEVLAGIYPMRRNHKLDEWKEFCKWIEGLPYSEIITSYPEPQI